MARDIENVNITLPGESDTIELIVNGEPTEVVIALDSWASAVHADDADTVSGHTVARDVLADEYTNAQIDSMVETAGTVKTVNTVQPDQNGNVQIAKADIGLGNVDNTSDASKPISTATQAALDLKVDKETGKGLSTNDFTDAEKTKLQDIEAGAQVNTVTGVKGSAESTYRTGNIDITKANIGLGNVDNTSDLNKPISTATQAALDQKVDKVAGKGLSTNDFTTAEKEKLAGIAAGAEVNVQSDWNEADSTADDYIKNKPTIPAKTSDLQNDSGFITGVNWGAIGGTLADQIDLNNELSALNTGLSSAVKSVNTETPDANGNVAIKAENIPANGMGTKETSGNPITITDGTPSTVKNLDVSLEPIQDLHGYANPWPGGAGENQFDALSWINLGVNNTYYSVDSDETITILSGDVGGISNRLFEVDAEETYSFLSTFANSMRIFDSNANTIAQETMGTFSAPSDGKIAIKFYASTYPTTGKFILVKGSTVPTAWKPYSNICPISGYDSVSVQRTGFNQWDEEWELGGLTWAGGQPFSADDRIRSKNFCPCLPSTNYYVKTPTGYSSVFWYKADNSFISYTDAHDAAVTSPSNAYYFKVLLQEATTYSNDISINYPQTETAYHAYSGSTATITLGQTVYGGTLDFDTGVLTVTHACTDMGDMNWTYENEYRFYSTSVRSIISRSALETVSQFRCSALKTSPAPINFLSPSFDHTICSSTSGIVYARSLEYSSGDDFKSAYTGQKIWYELATPIETTLTPAQLALLEGYNYITSNGTNISLDYYGSEATNVQAEIAEFETSIDRLTGSLATIETSPATATHVAGDLIVWNSQLYRVTSAIAVGETITIGTNVSRTTIADELKAIIAQLGA